MKTHKIHHVGKVVHDVREALTQHRALGFLVDDAVYTDIEQKVTVGKVDGGSCFLELLEPLDESSPIATFAKEHTNAYHHICIEVESIGAYLKHIEKDGLGFRLTKITRSVWDGRPVCFIGTHEKDIIELIE